MPEPGSTDRVRWFQGFGAKAWAAFAMVAALVVAVLAAVNGSVPAVLGAVVFGLLAHASIWRPAIGLGEDAVLLRGMYSTLTLPLGSIDGVVMSRMLVVTASGRRYVSSAVNRGRPSRSRTRMEVTPQDEVEIAVRAHVERGGAAGSGGPVRREWAWLEIALSVAALMALVISLVV